MTTTPGPVKLPPPSAGATGEAAVADVNGDRRDDVVATDAKGVSVYLGQADGTFSAPIHTDVVGNTPLFVTPGDFNNDHKVDAALWDGQTMTPLMGGGDGRFAPGVPATMHLLGEGTLAFRAASTRPIAADFNHDGSLDLASIVCQQPTVCVVLIMPGKGDGTFNATPWFSTDKPSSWSSTYLAQPNGLVAGDFDGDGNLDVLTAQNGASQGSPSSSVLSLGDGKGTFQPTALIAGNYDPDDVRAGDFNGDGILDLVITSNYGSMGAYQTAAFLGPVAAVTNAYKSNSFVPGARAAVGDLNGDGAPDLATIDVGSVEIGIGHGDGTFGTPTRYFADTASMNTPAWIDLGDFNGDGKRDVLVSGTQGLEVLINSGCMGSGINGITGGSFGGSAGSSGSATGSAGAGGGPTCNIGTPFQPPGAAMCPSNNQCSAPPYSCVTALAVEQGLKCCCDPAGHMCVGCQQTESCGGAYNGQPVSCCH